MTPVFNGSTSLRSAAGQMIENVTKSVRRGETVDDGYIQDLYQDMNALYRLDQAGAAVSGEKAALGQLPPTARALLGILAGAWVLIGVYITTEALKKRRANQRNDH